MLIDFHQLAKRHNIKLKDVLHLGANTGQEAETYQQLGAQRVVWVEAIGTIYVKLVKHLEKFPNQIAFCACVSDKTGEDVMFNITNNQCQSSSFLELGTHATEHPTVKVIAKEQMRTVTVTNLLMQNGIELERFGGFLNIDLQGAELLALRGMEDLLCCFDHLYIEVNDAQLYKGCALTPEIDTYLSGHGFIGKETKMTGSGWGDKYYRRI